MRYTTILGAVLSAATLAGAAQAQSLAIPAGDAGFTRGSEAFVPYIGPRPHDYQALSAGRFFRVGPDRNRLAR